MMILIKLVYVAALCLILCSANGPHKTLNFATRTKEKAAKLPPCKSCTVLTDSFKKGIETTNRGKHDGGDAAWEAEKMRSYKTSEVRLVEIQEMLCQDVTRGQDQCLTEADDHESLIEDWFFNHQNEDEDLFSWLCIKKLEVCCPPDHYGPSCEPCTECFGNGKCKGNGTRKGNGKCLCDTGYTGEFCKECDNGFYEAFRDEKKLLCSACHQSCSNDGCSGGGPKKCKSCKKGWVLTTESGCFDVNECLDSPSVCKEDQFCVNNEGSYSCLECDKSCKGCIADGPDMCKKCADDYELRDGKCVDLTSEKRDQYVSFTRFLTYLGLCIATCAIFQSSTSVACIVGIAVAIYIGASEYWLNTSPSGATPIVDTKQLEDMIKNSL